jgi:hypothetical protein
MNLNNIKRYRFEKEESVEYRDFIDKKTQIGSIDGFDPVFMPDYLFDFQKYLVEWLVKRGRGAIFADCGTGKTPMQLVWAENIARKTNGRILILTPLAVAAQTIRESEKFGIECKQSRDGKLQSKITVTNYERLHYFDPNDFEGVVLDESSAIKAFDGKRRKQVVRFMSKINYRLLCTATPSPNDFIELGVSSEALGILTQSEMLSYFFRSSDNARHSLFREGDFWNVQKWFFRAHSEVPFWRWVCTWARAMKKPSDLGFDDDGFILPPLNITQRVVKHGRLLDGELFPIIATTLRQQREERRLTMTERCEEVARLVDHKNPAVVWCQYNEEGDILEKLIPGCVQVAGRMSDEEKEEKLVAFTFNKVRVIVTKPKIGAWGLNWQHCGHHTFFPSHSFEQYYQATRRSWRFGRKDQVDVDIVTTEGEAGVTTNLQKKQDKADIMFANLIKEMNNIYKLENRDNHNEEMEVPTWLS